MKKTILFQWDMHFIKHKYLISVECIHKYSLVLAYQFDMLCIFKATEPSFWKLYIAKGEL